MLLFLTVFLLVQVDRAQQLNVSTYMIEQINGYRAQIAKGQMIGLGGTLPPTRSMFALQYDDFYYTIAEYNVMHCKPGPTLILSGMSVNYHQAPLMEDLSETTLINYVLTMWMDEMRQFVLGNQATYNNQNLKEFANMIYYKSTKAGCSYHQCNGTATSPAMYAIACAFDSEPQQNQPLYIVAEGGTVNGCERNSDCSRIIANSVCGPQGLCGTTFAVPDSTTGTSTTVQTTTSATTTSSENTVTTSSTSSKPTTTTETSTTGNASTSQSAYFLTLINGFREKVAKGLMKISNGEALPSSLNMFQLEYSTEMQLYAGIIAVGCPTKCNAQLTFLPQGGSLNYYEGPIPAHKDANALIAMTLQKWFDEIMNVYDGKVTYDNKKIKDFANMIYSNSTKAGCYYEACPTSAPTNYVVACVFNSAPQMGQPIYTAYTGGTVSGCNMDENCSKIFTGASCGPQGLCGFNFTKTVSRV